MNIGLSSSAFLYSFGQSGKRSAALHGLCDSNLDGTTHKARYDSSEALLEGGAPFLLIFYINKSLIRKPLNSLAQYGITTILRLLETLQRVRQKAKQLRDSWLSQHAAGFCERYRYFNLFAGV